LPPADDPADRLAWFRFLVAAAFFAAADLSAFVCAMRPPVVRVRSHTHPGKDYATDMCPLITGTDFITLPTRDFETAVGFYGGVLGLEESKRWGNMPAAEFETGNLTIAVLQSDAFGMEFNAHTHPVELHVDDFDAAKAELEQRGVEFKGETIDSGVCFQALFDDPDGNALAIHHRYSP
jgi:catechol 2,3-dioxygenase-like lactoylglutathione lyase family enzyme